ncbi:MAG: hypothetical protein ACJASX_003922 [Limisphaerales bacterium]|jgi:hypothetical protein
MSATGRDSDLMTFFGALIAWFGVLWLLCGYRLRIGVSSPREICGAILILFATAFPVASFSAFSLGAMAGWWTIFVGAVVMLSVYEYSTRRILCRVFDSGDAAAE